MNHLEETAIRPTESLLLKTPVEAPCPEPKEVKEKVKRLPPSVLKDIEQKNMARRLTGLSCIVVKVRRCVACGCLFESSGNRTCGCTNRNTGYMSGREIL